MFFSKSLISDLFLWMIFHIFSRNFRLTPLLHCISDTWSSVELKHFRYWYLLTFEANEPFINFEFISAWLWAEFNHQHLPMLVCIWSSFWKIPFLITCTWQCKFFMLLAIFSEECLDLNFVCPKVHNNLNLFSHYGKMCMF